MLIKKYCKSIILLKTDAIIFKMIYFLIKFNAGTMSTEPIKISIDMASVSVKNQNQNIFLRQTFL